MSTRRNALKNIAAGTAAGAAAGVMSISEVFAKTESVLGTKLNGKINHSVCKWCYGKIPLDTFAQECKKIGITSIELLGPEDWPTLKKYGLTCALPNGAGMGIEKGFNDLTRTFFRSSKKPAIKPSSAFRVTAAVCPTMTVCGTARSVYAG